MSSRFSAGTAVRVVLTKRGVPKIAYDATVVVDDGNHIVVRAPWAEQGARDLGFARFEPGDVFVEHYWRDRWYSVKQVADAMGRLKGWYCDVARPVHVRGDVVISEDLDLDLWVSADGATILRLDEEEFVSSGLSKTDPEAAAAARRALEELEDLAATRFAEVAGLDSDG